MNKKDELRFLTAIGKMAESYGERLSKGRIHTYMEDLEDFHIQKIESAFVTARRTSKRFPTVAEIREIINHQGEDYPTMRIEHLPPALGKEEAQKWFKKIYDAIEGRKSRS